MSWESSEAFAESVGESPLSAAFPEAFPEACLSAAFPEGPIGRHRLVSEYVLTFLDLDGQPRNGVSWLLMCLVSLKNLGVLEGVPIFTDHKTNFIA
jgi:hypothetical protein